MDEAEIALAKAALRAHWKADADGRMSAQRCRVLAYAAFEVLADANPVRSGLYAEFLERALSEVLDARPAQVD